jgi:hypothetical protein
MFLFIEVVRNSALLRPSLKGIYVRISDERGRKWRRRRGGAANGSSRDHRDLPSSVGNSLRKVSPKGLAQVQPLRCAATMLSTVGYHGFSSLHCKRYLFYCCGGGLYTAMAQENLRAPPPREGEGGGGGTPPK